MGRNLSIYIILKANDTKGSLVPGDNLEVGDIMYRLENPNASGQARYGINNFVSSDVAYNELLDGIRRITDSTEVRDKSNPDNKILFSRASKLYCQRTRVYNKS